MLIVIVGDMELNGGTGTVPVQIIVHTTIDGNGAGSTVTFESGEDSSAVLSGFHITGGSGGEAGGILADNATLRMTDVTVTRNAAYYDGGGIYCNNSTVELTNVVITDNTADLGGGIYCENSELSLTGIECTANGATSGGGIYCLSSNPNLKDVTLTENAALRGGGMFLYDSSPVFDTTDRCNIYLNRGNIGSDFYAYSSPVTSVVLDTFTVVSPTSYHAFLRDNFAFDILHGKMDQTESDLHVSPDGDDSDSGFSSSSPLKTVTQALAVILADEDNPHTIFLREGTYSPSTTGETFPLNVPSFVTLSGASTEDVVLNAEEEGGVIHLEHLEGVRLENLTVKGGLTAFGAGIYCSSSDPDLVNVAVREMPPISREADSTARIPVRSW